MDDLAFTQGANAAPLWVQIWMNWMGLVNFASLLFLRRIEARWILAAMLCNLPTMLVLAELNGYNRLLGIVHVIYWTPLLVYLLRRRNSLGDRRIYVTWVHIVMATITISLAFDYVDVVRYLLGDRS